MASQIVSGDRFVSGEALLERAGRAASGLESLGVGKGDTVALILRNDIAFLEARVAVGLLGAYPVAVNWHFCRAEAAYVPGDRSARANGRAPVCNPETNARLVCRLLIEKDNRTI